MTATLVLYGAIYTKSVIATAMAQAKQAGDKSRYKNAEGLIPG
jgi:hypothetical protein